MIVGTDQATRDIHIGVESRAARRFGADVRAVARRKLDLIGAAAEIRDLTVPPGNRLEKLKGSLAGFYSIRVNDQFRIVFKFEAGQAFVRADRGLPLGGDRAHHRQDEAPTDASR